MPRATNQVAIGPEPAVQRSSFRAKMALGVDSFVGRDERVEEEKQPPTRPGMELTNLLKELQQTERKTNLDIKWSPSLDAKSVNALYLKFRVMAQASVEYENLGSAQLNKLDFCKAMIREGICDNMALAYRFFELCDWQGEDQAGTIDVKKFVKGFAHFSPAEPMSKKLYLISQLFGPSRQGPTGRRSRNEFMPMGISEMRDALAYAYQISRHRPLTSVDDDLVRMMAAIDADTGIDRQGRVKVNNFVTAIMKIPEWREHFQHMFNDIFAVFVRDTAHHGYPTELHRTTYHDGRKDIAPAMGTPDDTWVCGSGGSLGYGGK